MEVLSENDKYTRLKNGDYYGRNNNSDYRSSSEILRKNSQQQKNHREFAEKDNLNERKLTPAENQGRDVGFLQRWVKREVDDVRSVQFWRACGVEFLATSLLCFYHIGILLHMPDTGSPPLLHVSIGHGLYVAAVVAALGDTGGCHMNPAVTVALFTLGHVRLIRTCIYVISQCAGAISGTLLLREICHTDMIGNLGLISPGDNISPKQVISTEVVVTAFLLIVVVATSDVRRKNMGGCVPLIVGLTVTVNTILSNRVSGSCMNPARAMGPAVVLGDFDNIWIYWAAPCVGALIGANLYDKILAPFVSPISSMSTCCQGEITRSDQEFGEQGRKLLSGADPETDV